jgi:tetratricopeptide (TPR) repeat protein
VYLSGESARQIRSVCSDFSGELKATGLPDISGIEDGPLLESFAFLQRIFEPWLKTIGYFSRSRHEPLNAEEEQYILDLVHHASGTESAKYQKETMREYRDVLSGCKGIDHLVQYGSDINIVYQAGDYARAEKLVDEALLIEINEKTNDPRNRASLLRIRSDTDERQGKYGDALAYFEEACRLEDSVPGVLETSEEERRTLE